jgi:hypothetical protein
MNWSTASHDYDVLVIGRVSGLCDRFAAHREGLPGRRAEAGRPVRGRRLSTHVLGPAQIPVGTEARLQGHPADPHVAR